jgi:hypothetical protein
MKEYINYCWVGVKKLMKKLLMIKHLLIFYIYINFLNAYLVQSKTIN